jgi:hypothetical protein
MSRTGGGVVAELRPSDFKVGQPNRDLVAEQKLIDAFLAQKFGGATADTGLPAKEFLDKYELLSISQYLLSAPTAEEMQDRAQKITQDLHDMGKFERHYRNIEFQEGAIRRNELPERTKIDVKQLAKQAQIYQLGTDPHPDIKKMEERVGVYSQSGFYPSSVFGGTNSAMMAVRENDARDEITKPIGKDIRNLTFDAGRYCLDDMAVAKARMRAHLRDEELTLEEAAKIRKAPGKVRQVTQNLTEFAAAKAYNFIDPFLRGTITKGNAKDSDLYLDYIGKRDVLIDRHANLINANDARNLAYLNMLKQRYAKQASMPGMEGMALQLAELEKMIDKQIEEVTKLNQADLTKFNEEINTLNKEMLGKAGELVEDKDAMIKFRILQILAIASPLGLFNYMIPIVNIFGPLFSASTTMGEGMAAIVTSDVFGPFGWLADAAEVDVVVEFLFDDVPIVSDLGAMVKEAINCAPFQELMGAMGPMATGSPLLPLAIAVVFSIRRFDAEAQHYEKYTAVEAEQMKKLEDAFDKFRKGINKDGIEASMKAFIGSQVTMIANAQLVSEAIDTISKATPEQLHVLDKFKFKCQTAGGPEESLTLAQIAGRTTLTPSVIADLFKTTTQENRTEMVKMLLVFNSTEVKGDLAKLADITANQELYKRIADAAFKERASDAVVTLAEEAHKMECPYDFRDPSLSAAGQKEMKEKAVGYYKKLLVEDGINQWKMLDKVLVPEKKPSDPTIDKSKTISGVTVL